jgi:hypothetical protein
MNLSSRLHAHLERGKVGFPTTLASSVGVIMASPVILTVTSGFGIGGDTFALAMLIAFIMMQAQLTTPSRKRRRSCRPPDRCMTISPVVWDAFLPLPARCRPT